MWIFLNADSNHGFSHFWLTGASGICSLKPNHKPWWSSPKKWDFAMGPWGWDLKIPWRKIIIFPHENGHGWIFRRSNIPKTPHSHSYHAVFFSQNGNMNWIGATQVWVSSGVNPECTCPYSNLHLEAVIMILGHLYTSFHQWGYPNSWMVYNKKSHDHHEHGSFRGPPILGNPNFHWSPSEAVNGLSCTPVLKHGNGFVGIIEGLHWLMMVDDGDSYLWLKWTSSPRTTNQCWVSV